MATIFNEKKAKEMKAKGEEISKKVKEFEEENILAARNTIKAGKRARVLASDLVKDLKEYRRLSLDTFDKDEETKKKQAAKRAERKAKKAAGETGTKKTAKKKTTKK